MPRIPQGFFEEIGPEGARRGETFTCAHCGNLYERPFRQDIPMCRIEMKEVCWPCHKKGTCTPFEKKLERMEARASLFKAAGIAH